MKEVCIDARMATYSGIGTYIRNLLLRLKSGPFKLKLIVDQTTIDKWPSVSGFELILTKAPIYSIEEQLKLPFLIPSCDLFWSPHFNIPLGPIRARKRLVTIHDVYHLAYKHVLSFRKRIYAQTVINRAVKISDRIVTDSNFSRDEIVKYTSISKDKIDVIHLGVDRGRFYPCQEGSTIKEKYQLPEKFFLFVSNLAPHKNIRGLLHALHFLKEQKLVFVGKRVQKNDWQRLLDENPSLQERVLFLGQVDEADLPSIYRLAYAVVHPSFYEGFGLTPLEAMSCGCPVVVSNAASLPEVCGDCAVYVDPHDPENIAQGINKIMRDTSFRQDLMTKGLERSKLFNWDTTAERHIEMIDRLFF